MAAEKIFSNSIKERYSPPTARAKEPFPPTIDATLSPIQSIYDHIRSGKGRIDPHHNNCEAANRKFLIGSISSTKASDDPF
jgi:hypothetical protein